MSKAASEHNVTHIYKNETDWKSAAGNFGMNLGLYGGGAFIANMRLTQFENAIANAASNVASNIPHLFNPSDLEQSIEHVLDSALPIAGGALQGVATITTFALGAVVVYQGYKFVSS